MEPTSSFLCPLNGLRQGDLVLLDERQVILVLRVDHLPKSDRIRVVYRDLLDGTTSAEVKDGWDTVLVQRQEH